MDHKGRPSPHLTADTYSTIMCLDNLLHNGKTETRATPPSSRLTSRTGRIDLIEAIKETRQRCLWDADACIRYGDFHFRPSLDRVKSHLSVRGRELQGVIHYIGEDLCKPVA